METRRAAGMSNRRMEMWKILYNLVNRTDQLKDFNFVDDILCKDPSLIRPYSLREHNNRFQDTFIVWIFNKLINSLGHASLCDETRLQNVVLQHGILTSCLTNRPALFKRLTKAYMAAIEQLCAEQTDETSDDNLEVFAFTVDDMCLREIDVSFSFQPIRVCRSALDGCILALLEVLQHALHIGYETFPALFLSAMRCVCQALKECDMPTKLLCLHYADHLFAKAALELAPSTPNQQLWHYEQLVVCALSLLWTDLPLWQQANLLSGEELRQLGERTASLLATLRVQEAQLLCREQLWQHAFNLLDAVATMRASDQQGSISQLVDEVVDFLLALQCRSSLSEQQMRLLVRWSATYPRVVRLLAVAVCSANANSEIWSFFKCELRTLLSQLHQLESGRWALLEELLAAIVYLEQHDYRRQQLECSDTNAHFAQVDSKLANLLAEDALNTQKLNMEDQLDAFLRRAAQCRSSGATACWRIARRLLEVATLRPLISACLQKKLITFYEQLLLLPTTRAPDAERTLIAVHALTAPLLPAAQLTGEVQEHWQRTIEHVAATIFKPPQAPPRLLLAFCENLPHLLKAGHISRAQIIEWASGATENVFAALIRCLCCSADCWLPSPYDVVTAEALKIDCSKCRADDAVAPQRPGIRLPCPDATTTGGGAPIALPASLKRSLCLAAFTRSDSDRYRFVAAHLDALGIGSAIALATLNVLDLNALQLPVWRACLRHFIVNDAEVFLQQYVTFLLGRMTKSLLESDCGDRADAIRIAAQQQRLLDLVAAAAACSTSAQLTELWLFHFFKLTFFYMLHPNSHVPNQAVLCASELCSAHGVQPGQLWSWYKRDGLALIVRLAVQVYLSRGVRLIRSMRPFTMMLGFSCVQEFVCKYYRLLTTMLLPYCVKETRCCKGLLVGIAKITRKTISTLFVASFLRIYTHIYLTETSAIGNRCIDYIVQCTDFSIRKLLNTDVKLTVSEFLIYFNRNPEFVMRAFQFLLLQENGSSSGDGMRAPATTLESKAFAKFIADRLLGVITYFEACLADPSFEKSLKEEALYSLGQIIRCVGPQHVTQFRFKIIAMLSFVLTLPDRHLQLICLKIWNIFLRIVNVQELGPSLSRIVASLQPLLRDNVAEVNAIYEFVILKNASMLGAHIPDLYFVERVPLVLPAIRQCVARQTELLRSNKTPLLEKLGFYYKQITNEHLPVRVYGLEHLRDFIGAHRAALNNLVLSEMRVEPLLESIVDMLMAGCRHEDRLLQLASAKCLGELGAIDPSYLPFNYSYEQRVELPLGIHTDEFAIMALTELCRAHQFQKETKYMDNYALAIQETLAVCGVSPRDNKKLAVWQAVPARMRQVMEPLLTSCYTASRREFKTTEHPIFSGSSCQRYEDWAFAWASRLIECVRGEETRHLLNAYKPSMKRDNNTLALFFPYALLHALQECSDAEALQIAEEFEAVFSFSANGSANETPSLVVLDDDESAGGGGSVTKEFPSSKLTPNIAGVAAQDSAAAQTSTAGKTGSRARKSTKLCAEQVDFLSRWLREWQRLNIGAIASLSATAVGGVKEPAAIVAYKRVQALVAKLGKLQIAHANYNTGDFARALRALETYIEAVPSGVEQSQRLQQQISFLIQIHGQLMDSDAVEGAVYAKKSTLTLEEEILVHRIVDRPHDAMTCYEQLISGDEPLEQVHIRGMINCYLRMDAPETALLITDGLWQKLTDTYTDAYFKECKTELLWRLGRYDQLDQLLIDDDAALRRQTTNWNIQCAEAFLLFRQPTVSGADFATHLDVIRGHVLSTMRSGSAGALAGQQQQSYAHTYDEVVRLHLLDELEKCKRLVDSVLPQLESAPTTTTTTTTTAACLITTGSDTRSDDCLAAVHSFFADWEARLSVLQPIVRVLEPVLCFRRNLLRETITLLGRCRGATAVPLLVTAVERTIANEIGKLWIGSVQMNRDAGNLQQAHLCLMKAEAYAPPTFCLEKAKLLWLKGEQSSAFKLLDEELERIETKCQHNLRLLESGERALYGEVKYLQAVYNSEALNICAELNLRYFRQAIAGNRFSEKLYCGLAQYLEKIYDSLTTQQKADTNGRQLIIDVMLNYGKSLKYGYENVYQSLPRLLGFWLDHTSQLAEQQTGGGDGEAQQKAPAVCSEDMRKMNELINGCCNMLPTSIFYTAFSQLLSRICHPSSDVFHVLRNIVVKLVEHFPQQSLWMLLPVLKSSYTNRIKRCQLILRDARLCKAPFQKLINDFNMLAERLIELTNKELASGDSTYQLSALVRQLPRLFEDVNFSPILLPFEKYMQASFPMTPSTLHLALPNSGGGSGGQTTTTTTTTNTIPSNPFPYKAIYISGIGETVTVLRSAAKPKKISIQCSDGEHHEVMVKPKDDLRKDFRLMEFNGLVKRYLHQSADARQRRLRIRTYAAIPFNEECGLVEWLPRLNSFRAICTSLYRSRGLGLSDRVLRQCALPRTETLETKRKVFLDTLLPRHPPIFHEWLRQRFPSPHNWYEARSAYVRTIAVMSMVGYILGLGDRHGENVLFDETNGDAVHVDFNCLFNQGEQFAFPELVPFRLTHNMVFAMGPLGVEGVYRKSCEITLRLLKRESQTLISVLRPFVYDLVVLARNTSTKRANVGELTDPKAMQDVRRIEERLKGYVKRTSANSMPLSVEGQVNFLIGEATSINNLAAMYIGWGSYI